MKVAVQFAGLETNEEGMIAEEDLFALMDSAIDAYDELLEQYTAEEEEAA